MVERMALLSTQFERATREDVARMAENVLTVPDLAALRLELEPDALGQRWFPVTDAGRCAQGICRPNLEVRNRARKRRHVARCAEFRLRAGADRLLGL